MDLVPDPLLIRKSGSAGIEPGTSGSVARNSDDRGGLWEDNIKIFITVFWDVTACSPMEVN
jgi:hypothetical protein